MWTVPRSHDRVAMFGSKQDHDLENVPRIDPGNDLENVPRIDPGIDPWNVLENASICSRDCASIQTSRHGHENEERSSLHKQLIFVAFGVP